MVQQGAFSTNNRYSFGCINIKDFPKVIDIAVVSFVTISNHK